VRQPTDQRTDGRPESLGPEAPPGLGFTAGVGAGCARGSRQCCPQGRARADRGHACSVTCRAKTVDALATALRA